MKKIRLIFVLVMLNALITSKTFLTQKNTLNRNGNWQSTKTTLEKGLMGGHEFMENPVSLYKEKLNLGAWHGFQEIIYSKKVNPKSVSFDFFLEKESYLYFIFNKTDAGFSGIRISNNDSLPNQYIEANNSGEFLHSVPIYPPIFSASNWQSAQVHFKQNGVDLIVDDQLIKIPLNGKVQSSKLGFRGSSRKSYIDNVTVVDESSQTVFKENFSNSKKTGITLLTSILGLIVLNTLLGIGMLCLDTKKNQLFNRLITLNIVIFLCISQIFLYIYFYANKQYPTSDTFLLPKLKKVKVIENDWLEEELKFVNQQITKQMSHSETNKNSTRIMFIGSSQTWGAGASTENNTFVSLAQKKLNNNVSSSLANSRISTDYYELINTGISGTTSSDLLALYENNWIRYEPDIVIINLSVNDSDYSSANPDLFKNNLEKFVKINKEKEIQTVFLLEATTPEQNPHQLSLHSIMIQVAKDNEIPYFDLHQYLKNKNNSGIIWWDFVHLTDYGHELTAEFIVNEVLPHLKISSE